MLNKHYARLDIKNNIIDIFNPGYRKLEVGDVLILDNSEIYMSSEALPEMRSLKDLDGFYLFKYDGKQVVRKTSEEVEFEKANNYDFQLKLCYLNRIRDYGSLADQMDEQFRDYAAWQARIAAVKAKYPKPNIEDFEV